MDESDMASKFKRVAMALVLCALNLEMLTSKAYLQGQPANQRRPVKRAESRDQWYADGRRAVEAAKQLRANRGQARNVILFVGDGMGVSTVTAARILEGQLRGESG
jgi:alkaline phosphatase